MSANKPPDLRREIERAVDQPWPEECVIFSGTPHPTGYGFASIDGQKRRAHVYACELAHGPRPPGKRDVAHSCGTKLCINPGHLRWATRAENEADKLAHGRSNRGGERSGAARLTREQVLAIRETYTTQHTTQQALADKYGVHLMTINDIINRRTWNHVADQPTGETRHG